MYYEDDQFHPTNEENYISKPDAKALHELKMEDKGYRKIKRKVDKPRSDGTSVKKFCPIELYVSGDVGSYIRNAVSGQSYNYQVGNKSEDLLFKVGVATGELGVKTGSLFYDTPEQYERHFFVVIDNNIKEKWYEKNLQARRNLSGSNE